MISRAARLELGSHVKPDVETVNRSSSCLRTFGPFRSGKGPAWPAGEQERQVRRFLMPTLEISEQ